MHFIQYQKKQLPIKIDFASITRTTNILKIDFHKYESVQRNGDHLLVAFIEALKRGHKLEGIPFELTEEECENILSESFGDFLAIFGEALFNFYLPTEQKKREFMERIVRMPLNNTTIPQ